MPRSPAEGFIMHTDFLAVALALALAGAGAPQGAVTEVSAEAPSGRTDVLVTVRGSNPCGAVTVDYGDGTKITHAIVDLPSTHAHQYTKPGQYRVTAGGNGNCGGNASTSINVRPSHVRARPDADPADAPRLPAMDALDLDGNGTVWIEEWKGATERFRAIDRNNDDALSRQELEDGAADVFASLDENGDRRIGPREWRTPRQSFDRYDDNRDGFVTPAEFGVSAAAVRAAAQAGAGPDTAGRATPGRTAVGRAARGLGKSGATIAVRSSEEWTDTGLTVEAGDMLRFRADGTIRLTAGRGDMATPGGAKSGRQAADAPLPDVPAGALIARVGNSPPMLIGDQTRAVRMPASGRLFLGVNDDHHADNSGVFRVTVMPE
jgi:hypothetical protein